MQTNTTHMHSDTSHMQTLLNKQQERFIVEFPILATRHTHNRMFYPNNKTEFTELCGIYQLSDQWNLLQSFMSIIYGALPHYFTTFNSLHDLYCRICDITSYFLQLFPRIIPRSPSYCLSDLSWIYMCYSRYFQIREQYDVEIKFPKFIQRWWYQQFYEIQPNKGKGSIIRKVGAGLEKGIFIIRSIFVMEG